MFRLKLKSSTMVTGLLFAFIACAMSAHLNIVPPREEDTPADITEENPTGDTTVPAVPSTYIKVPRLSPTKTQSKQDTSKASKRDDNDENIVPDPASEKSMSEDEMVFQWRALKLNKNGNKFKIPITNDQEAETETPKEDSAELDEHVPGGKDLVVYNTLASVRGADRRAQGTIDNGEGDLQPKKGPFFRG